MKLNQRPLIYIPTNRLCSPAIIEQLLESRWVAESQSGQPIFLLIDSSDAETSAKHDKTIRDNLPSGVRGVHLTQSRQDAFVGLLTAELSSQDRADATRLLLPAGISYGRGPNLAALVAVSADCTTVHRRDSDGYHDPSRSADWPVELELRALGEPYSAFLDLLQSPAAGPQFRTTRIELAGSGMFGSPTIDRRDLFETSEQLGVQLQALGRPGVDLEEVRVEARRYLIQEPRTRYSTDFFSLEESARVEMGNVGIVASALTLIPEMPTGIIGCDYMVKDLLWRLGRPEVFHSRKLLHLFDAVRDTADSRTETQLDYVIRDVQYLQFGRVHSLVGKQMSQSLEMFEAKGHFLPSNYAEQFRQAAIDAKEEMRRVRTGAVKIYAEAAKLAHSGISEKFARVSERLQERGEAIDREVVDSVNEFARLIDLWPALLDAARLINPLVAVAP